MVGTVLAQQHSEGAGAEVPTQLVACSRVTHQQQDAGCADHSGHDQDQGKMDAGRKLKAGETAILYLGTDKSALASQVLVMAQSKQTPVGHFPVSTTQRLTSYLEKILSCVHSILCYLALEFGPERKTEQQRRECCVAPFVQPGERGKQILCLVNLIKKQ